MKNNMFSIFPPRLVFDWLSDWSLLTTLSLYIGVRAG